VWQGRRRDAEKVLDEVERRVSRAARGGSEAAAAEINAIRVEAAATMPAVVPLDEAAVGDSPLRLLVNDVAAAFTREYVDGTRPHTHTHTHAQ